MSFKADQFRDLVVAPTLDAIGLNSPAAVNLLLMTCAQESHFGQYLHQLGKGPAVGVYQMEPVTYRNHWENFLNRRPLGSKVRMLAGYRYASREIPAEEMIGNLFFATAMCRIHYYRRPEALPAADDIAGLARYYKQWYNTPAGAANVDEVIDNYHRFVEGK